jgi:hypothetical protein
MAFLPSFTAIVFQPLPFINCISAIEVFNTAVPQSRRKAASNVPTRPGNSSLLCATVRRAQNQQSNDTGISRAKGYGT